MSPTPHTHPAVTGAFRDPKGEEKLFFRLFVFVVIAFASLSLYFFPHIIDGDAVGYLRAVHVYQGEAPEPHLAPGQQEVTLDLVTIHRMLTGPLSIQAVRVFSDILGSDIWGWLAWDTILFVAANILFYLLLLRIFRSPKVAFVGGLFFTGNYSMVVHGLALFMDMSGWFFYVLSIFCLFTYSESGKYRDLFFAALAIAIGGLFKENAFVAYIPLAAMLLYENMLTPIAFLKRIIPLTLLIVVPTLMHHIAIYERYGYTYLFWARYAKGLYPYPSRLIEYFKSLGSLLTFLAPISLLGAFTFFRSLQAHSGELLDMRRTVFIASVVVSSIPAVLWPAITQRVLFMVVPGAVMLACVVIQRYERYWWAFLPFAALYTLAGFFMDSFILNFVNLPF